MNLKVVSEHSVEITEAKVRDADLEIRLLHIWKSSVSATHDFLSVQDIVMLRPEVCRALQNVPVLLVALENGELVGFLGIDGDKIEMLFIDAFSIGRGIGKKLMFTAFARGACCVDVNEQNKHAFGFYRHMGFSVSGRSDRDTLGLPFPILHMKKC